MPAAAPMNIAGKTGPPRKLEQRQRVGEALAEDEQQQSADRPRRRTAPTSPGSADCPENRTSEELLSVACPKPMASPAISDPEDGHEQDHPRLHVGPDRQREPLDAAPQERGDDAEHDGPQEHRAGGLPEGGEVRDRERERPEARQRVEADEDRARRCPRPAARGAARARASAPPMPAGLQQQERAQQRRAEQRADGGEAAGRGDDGRRGGRGVARGEAHRQRAEPAAHEDQRGLGAEHRRRSSASPSAASRMPGSSIGAVTPPAWNPSAGECPPMPGRRWMARATRTPATASNGSGHHAGAASKPEVLREVS